MVNLDELEVWWDLTEHQRRIEPAHLRELFEADSGRGERLSVQAGDLYRRLLQAPGHRRDPPPPGRAGRRASASPIASVACSAASRLNTTEDRAVLHTALRRPSADRVEVDGVDVVAEVHEVLERMRELRRQVRSGDRTGHTGSKLDQRREPRHRRLGPRSGHGHRGAPPPRPRRRHLRRSCRTSTATTWPHALAGLDPAETLFVVCSKTLHHRRDPDQRPKRPDGGSPTRSATTRVAIALRRGVHQRRSGRRVRHRHRRTCSASGTGSAVATRVDSAIGLSLMIAIGPDAFDELLGGFHVMDEHFRTAPLEPQRPGAPGAARRLVPQLLRAGRRHAVLPYATSLEPLPRLPPAARHGEQRQVGATRRLAGRRPTPARSSGASPGTNGQHAFYQLLHQGTTLVPCDFIGFAGPVDARGRTTTTC